MSITFFAQIIIFAFQTVIFDIFYRSFTANVAEIVYKNVVLDLILLQSIFLRIYFRNLVDAGNRVAQIMIGIVCLAEGLFLRLMFRSGKLVVVGRCREVNDVVIKYYSRLINIRLFWWGIISNSGPLSEFVNRVVHRLSHQLWHYNWVGFLFE